MKNQLIKGLAIVAVMTLGGLTVKAQDPNVTYATNEVSISIQDVIGIVDDANNQIDAFTEATAYSMGAVNFSYPDAGSYSTDQTQSGGYFNVSASTAFDVQVRAAAANFTSTTAGTDVIPISVLNITATTPAGITVTEIPAGGLTTTYQAFALGGPGTVMAISPSYTIPATAAQADIFGKETGTYTLDIYYQVSPQ